MVLVRVVVLEVMSMYVYGQDFKIKLCQKGVVKRVWLFLVMVCFCIVVCLKFIIVYQDFNENFLQFFFDVDYGKVLFLDILLGIIREFYGDFRFCVDLEIWQRKIFRILFLFRIQWFLFLFVQFICFQSSFLCMKGNIIDMNKKIFSLLRINRIMGFKSFEFLF